MGSFFRILRYWRVWDKMIREWEKDCVILRPGESVTLEIPLSCKTIGQGKTDGC